MKAALRALLGKLGYRVTKIPNWSQKYPSLSSLEIAISALLSVRESLRIVQIGANDGVLNDPIYEIVKKFKDRTEIVLIEPQPAIIPYLAGNYSYHPAHHIYNGAVGPGGSIRLYCVKQEVWGDLRVPYAKGWPEYRAPTGVTSSDQNHVKRWLSRNYRGSGKVEELIEEVVVPCSNLKDVLSRYNIGKIDVLQVDVEGMDDQVIYNCGIESVMPELINFESHSIGASSYDALEDYLIASGYVVSKGREDTLAIRCV